MVALDEQHLQQRTPLAVEFVGVAFHHQAGLGLVGA